MDAKKLTGPNAGSIKYDLITAMSVVGLAGKPTLQTSMTRLIALVTARYNWFRDEVTVGQRDIAKMWSVDQRTVKREMKRLVEAGILLKLRHGVRGRVAAYRLNYREIVNLTEPHWALVGPDFVERMSTLYPRSAVKVVKVDFGKKPLDNNIPMTGDRAGWRKVRQYLRENDESIFQNWYSKLTFKSVTDSELILTAPNNFIAQYILTHLQSSLLLATQEVLAKVDRIRIEVEI
jgi:DNA-binding Lrp family transcriptional regulator